MFFNLKCFCVNSICQYRSYHKICEFVMTPDMGIVGRQSHQKVDQGHDHQDAGSGGDEEHQLRLLDIVDAEHLDLGLALHQHVHTLRSLWKQKVEWVEVNTSLIPLDFLSTAYT